jgi:dCTP deaminase
MLFKKETLKGDEALLMTIMEHKSHKNNAAKPQQPSSEKSGVFTAEALRGAVAAGVIIPARDLTPQQIQPSSLDLTLGNKAWRIRASFLAGPGRKVEQRLDDGLKMHELDLQNGAVLEKGCVYLVPLRERLALPADISAMANPKSSTGRIDVFVRLVVDGGTSFETVPAGYQGPLYAEISPRTFSIVVREGSSLNQLRLRRGSAIISDEDLHAIHQKTPIVDGKGHFSGGLGLSVQLQGEPGETIGYVARRHAGVIDVDKIGTLDPHDFWRPIEASREGSLVLDPNEFYILASREWLKIPENLAAEMVPIDPLLGEYRVHYAGFFDPGFGVGAGSKAVLEVRGHDAPFMLEHGQLVARLVYEWLIGVPETLYGQGLKSNYQGQSLKLSKHFKS